MSQDETNVIVLFIIIGIIWSVLKNAIDQYSSKSDSPGRSLASLAPKNQALTETSGTYNSPNVFGDLPADVVRDLELIRRVDPRFNVRQFLDSGRLVYEAVVMAFAKGDRDLLRELASDEVYAAFLDVIEQRERRNERVELEFVQIDDAKILNISLFNTQAQITIGVAAQLVTATRGEYGAVICGDPNSVLNVSELWTFACEFSSRKPAWKLIATDTV